MNTEKNSQTQKTEDKAMENVVSKDKTKRKILLLAAIGAALVLVAAIVICVNVFGDSDRKLQEQLDLGAKYLEEMDYEQALVAFNTALSIDPKNADAYLGIMEVYIRTNDFESALEYAKEGYEATGNESLKEKIDMIESGNIFASNGWLMKRSCYDDNGGLVYQHEFTYNLKGQQASITKYDAQGVQEQYLEYAYDEEGRRLIGAGYALSDGNLEKSVGKYDGNNYHSTVYEGTSDVISGYREIEFDALGRAIKDTKYNKDGEIIYIYEEEYDESGNKIKTANYNGNNELEECTVYTYDEKGRELQRQSYGGNGELISYIENTYDADGNDMGTRYYDGDGELIEYGETVYDADGNEIGTRRYDGDGELIEYMEYVYDADGNEIGARYYYANGVLQYALAWQE